MALAIGGHVAALSLWQATAPAPAGEQGRAAALQGAPGTWQARQLQPVRPAVQAPRVPLATAHAAAADPPVARALPAKAQPEPDLERTSARETRGAHVTPPAGAARPAAAPAPSSLPSGDVADATDPPAVAQAAAQAAAQATAARPIPTYRTEPPPALALEYEVQHGGQHGRARLEWRVDTDTDPASDTLAVRRYSISLRGAPAPGDDLTAPPADGAARARAALSPHWTSQGRLDADGIAPERFAVSRRGRERNAANFRRDVGHISFSGPAHTWPLAAGAQDRLSWMVQLAAILQAEPALASTPGTRLSMMVAGAHGDAAVWTFAAHGSEIMPGPGGELIEAHVFRREAEHPHDADVEVAVAREFHHLPLRLRLTRRQGGESTEFRLRALQAP